MKRKRPTNNRGVRTHKNKNESNPNINNNNKTFSQNILNDIKNKFILKKIFNNIEKKRILHIIQFNKNLQNKLSITLDDYKKECKIIFEIFPSQKSLISESNDSNIFLNYFNEESKPYYHIYFNDNEEEVKRNYFNGTDKISKIKVVIDNEI